MHSPTVVNNSNYTRNTKIGDGSCTVDGFLSGDSDLSVCVWRWMMTIGIQDSLKSLGKIKIHGEEVAIIDRDSDDEMTPLTKKNSPS